MTSIFISYSRKDINFAEKIVQSLAENNLDTWVDWKSIPKGEDWQQEIYRGIEGADAFLFLLSPDAVKSEICNKEITHAVENSKRILPILIHDTKTTDFHDALPRQEISRRNWIFCREGQDNFAAAIGTMVNVIHTDYEWLNYHTRLLVNALEWERNNHENSFLLRGKELQDAELQLATNTSKEPYPTDLQRDYVLRSRQATDRQRRITTGIAIAGFISLAVLAIVAILQAGIARDAEATAVSNASIAETERANALSEANARATAQAQAEERARIARAGELAAYAVSQRDQQFDLSLLLSVEAFFAADNARTRGVLLDNSQTNPQLVQYLRGHSGWVLSVAFSPDGKTLASASVDQTIILWDVATRQQIGAPLRGHTDSVSSVVFSPDGKTLASADADKTIILWDVTTQQQIGAPLRGHSGAINSLAFSPDGKTLASGSWDRTIVLWDVATQQQTGAPLQGHSDTVWSVAFSPDGKTLASGSSDKTIILWDVAAQQQIGAPLQGHSRAVVSVAFSPDGKTLASASWDQTIILWDVAAQR